MKNKEIIILILFIILCLFIVIFSTINLMSELKGLSMEHAAEYESLSKDVVESMTDAERLQLVNKYTLVNSDEFSINNLYNMLSKEYLNKFNNVESFESYLNDSIIKNIDISRDYLNVEKQSQTGSNGIVTITYVINVYTSQEYIKLFDYESNEKPNIKFSYKVVLIEDTDNYSFEIFK